jgi:hypothetical protein
VPVNSYVRNIAALESMSGIFFVAVVVARLVSSQSHKPTERSRFFAHEANGSEGDSKCGCKCDVTFGVRSSS